MKSETNDHADVAPDDTIEDAAPPPSSSSTRGDVDMQALGGATTTTATSAEVPTTDAADDDHDEDVEGDENHMDPDAVAAATVAASYVISVDPNSPHPGELAGASSKWSKNGYGAPVLKQNGKFTKEETELVRAAVEEYCNTKQITVSRLCSECDHKAELKGAWMEISKRLPHRSVQSVYRHGIRQCHPFKRGAWSEQEVATLQDMVTRLGKKWSAIQAKLNRSADSCRDKYREMSDEFVKGRWKEEETETLKQLIRDYLVQATNGAMSHIQDMKDLGKFVEEHNIQIPFSTISKSMGKRSRLSCFKKWQKMTGLFSPMDVYSKREKTIFHEFSDAKRVKLEGTTSGSTTSATAFVEEGRQPSTAGEAAAAAAAAAVSAALDAEEDTAKIAAETVEALELPDPPPLGGAATTMSV